MTYSASWRIQNSMSVSFFLYCLTFLCTLFQEIPTSGGIAFKARNYSRQPASGLLFVISVNLSFLMEFETDFIKDTSSAKMFDSFEPVNLFFS